jgi:hypothetical protein
MAGDALQLVVDRCALHVGIVFLDRGQQFGTVPLVDPARVGINRDLHPRGESFHHGWLQMMVGTQNSRQSAAMWPLTLPASTMMALQLRITTTYSGEECRAIRTPPCREIW